MNSVIEKQKQKPWWVETIGTIASMVSAISAIAFGISALIISSRLAELQISVAQDAARARDNDALVRFADILIKEGAKYSKSHDCMSVFAWQVKNNRITEPEKLIRERDAIRRNFQIKIPDQTDIESRRANCVTPDDNSAVSNFFFVFNIHEMALNNWNEKISDDRKATYYTQMYVGTCTQYGKIREILDLDKKRLKSFYVEGFPNITKFVSECDNAKKYIDKIKKKNI